MDKLINRISQLGDQLVHCNIKCEGVNNNPDKGIIPRCLHIESHKSEKENGCLVVGINPDRSSDSERQYYLKNGITYHGINDFWNKNKCKNDYYKDVRNFLNCAGYTGVTLWTGIIKCENGIDKHWTSLQTARQCALGFLSRELEIVPEYWPIIAIGRETHKALSYLYPFKSVLGVPHPVSRAFENLFVNGLREQLKPDIQLHLDKFKQEFGTTLWLS